MARRKVRENPRVTSDLEAIGIPERDLQVLKLMSLYRDKVTQKGGHVNPGPPYPAIKRTGGWTTYSNLYRHLLLAKEDPFMFLEAQFKYWPEEAVHPWPFTNNFATWEGPTYAALKRLEKYKTEIDERYNGHGTTLASDDLIESFKDSKYAVDTLIQAHDIPHPFRAFVQLARELHPAYVACQPQFVEGWLPRMPGGYWDDVRKMVVRISEDPIYRARVLEARRKVLGF